MRRSSESAAWPSKGLPRRVGFVGFSAATKTMLSATTPEDEVQTAVAVLGRRSELVADSDVPSAIGDAGGLINLRMLFRFESGTR